MRPGYTFCCAQCRLLQVGMRWDRCVSSQNDFPTPKCISSSEDAPHIVGTSHIVQHQANGRFFCLNKFFRAQPAHFVCSQFSVHNLASFKTIKVLLGGEEGNSIDGAIR